VLDRQAVLPADTLAEVLAADAAARQTARQLISTEFGGTR